MDFAFNVKNKRLMLLSIIIIGVMPNLYGMEERPHRSFNLFPIPPKAQGFFGTAAIAFSQESQGFQESQGWIGWAWHGAFGVLNHPVGQYIIKPMVFSLIYGCYDNFFTNKKEFEKLAIEERKLALEERRERIELMRAERKRVEFTNETMRVILRNAHREEISEIDALIKGVKTVDEKEKFLQQRKEIIDRHNQVINTPPEIVQVEVNRRNLYD